MPVRPSRSNGNIEKWFHKYKRCRRDFATFEAFADRYGKVRPHPSLDEDRLEAPEQAFCLKDEDILAGHDGLTMEREMGGSP